MGCAPRPTATLCDRFAVTPPPAAKRSERVDGCRRPPDPAPGYLPQPLRDDPAPDREAVREGSRGSQTPGPPDTDLDDPERGRRPKLPDRVQSRYFGSYSIPARSKTSTSSSRNVRRR